MLQISDSFKELVLETLLSRRSNAPDVSDSVFAKQFGILGTAFSQIKKGKMNVLSSTKWIGLGRELGIRPNERHWNIVKTDVFITIEEDILFCKEYSKARICVDDCEIGKTTTAKYLSRTVPNCFYVDASQAKSTMVFIRHLAKALGLDHRGRIADIKADIKDALNTHMSRPIVIIDEAGDLDHEAFLVVKELWNGTENSCGWYMMGAEGLRDKIQRGIRKKGVGFKEIFSRFSSNYTTTTPAQREEKLAFYKKLITEVLTPNMKDRTKLPEILKRCLVQDDSGQIGGLRRAESLLILMEGEE